MSAARPHHSATHSHTTQPLMAAAADVSETCNQSAAIRDKRFFQQLPSVTCAKTASAKGVLKTQAHSTPGKCTAANSQYIS